MRHFNYFNCLLSIISICLSSYYNLVDSAPTTTTDTIDPNIGAIETAVEALPENSLVGDQQLVQKADRINGLTTYRHPEGDKMGKGVFHRKVSDHEKKVVVLGAGEDYLKHSSSKRTYVVLKRTPTDPKIYNVFYAYVRDAKGDEPGAVSIGDKKRLIEFDTWDARGSSKNLQRALGWTSCFQSVYPPCKNDVVEQVQVIKNDPEEMEYSQEDVEPPPQGHPGEGLTELVKHYNSSRLAETSMKSESGVDVASYYDFFVDLDETPPEVAFVVRTVGTYTYSLSAATATSPPETLLLAGIKPTEPKPGTAAQMEAMKEEDMNLAVKLFKEVNGDKSEGPALTTPAGGTKSSGRSVEQPVDMARVQRLKDQYTSLHEKLDSLSKLYPNEEYKGAAPKDPTGSESPNDLLTLLKSKALYLSKKIGGKGLSVLEGILEQSEVGQELKDNPDESQDLLNEQDPTTLKELKEVDDEILEGSSTTVAPAAALAGATTPPSSSSSTLPSSNGSKDLKLIADKKKKVEELNRKLKQIREAKKEQRHLTKVNKKLKEKAKLIKQEAPRNGGLLNGGLLGLLLGSPKARSAQKGRSIDSNTTAFDPMTPKPESPLSGLVGSLMQGGMKMGTGLLTSAIASEGGQNLMASLMAPVMDSMQPDGSISYFRLITGVGGTLAQTAISKVPIVGGPLSTLSGLFGSAAKGAAGMLGLGRSFGDGPTADGSSDTNLFGQIGWRSSDINSEELATQSLLAEEGSPFLGFGNCPKKFVALVNFEKSNSAEELVELYTTVLRTQCSELQKKQIVKLFPAGILKLNSDKSFSIDETSALLNKSKLTKLEEGDLAGGFEMAMFSKALISEWKKPTTPTNPDGSKITPTIHTFIKAALNSLDEGRKHLPLHFIKLARNSGLTLRTGFTKLLQDYDRYKACSKCTGEIMTVAKADLLALEGLIQFIVAGLGPVDKGSKEAAVAYKEFFTLNKAALEDRIKPFL